jgi:hypothetical protein
LNESSEIIPEKV